jgi:hypothetical protein
MRGTLTTWDEIREFFVKRGFDKAKLDKNCFDGFKIVSADIHEPLDGYAVYRESAPDIFAQFDRLECSVDRPTDYYRDFYIGECKRTREAMQLVDDLYEMAAMDPQQPKAERNVEKELLESLNLEVMNDIAAMSGRNVIDYFKGKLSYNEDGTPVVTPNF